MQFDLMQNKLHWSLFFMDVSINYSSVIDSWVFQACLLKCLFSFDACAA